MACSTPKRWGAIRRSLLIFAAAALALIPCLARAQQTAAPSAPAVKHPVVIMGAARPAPVVAVPPVRASVPAAVPRAGSILRWLASPARFATPPRVVKGVPVAGSLSERDFLQSVFETPSFIEPFFLSAPFPGGFGYSGSVSRFGGLPLGWGLWPACDSTGTPGVYWTVGPCFGVGAYSEELTSGVGSEYPLGTAPPSGYIFPLLFVETQPAPGAAAAQNPSALAPAMLLYLTGGKTIAAADWWVAHGRLEYLTDSGEEGSADLSQLDLEQTIKQNQARGLEFRLKFTPPSNEYPPAVRP